jgi:hypothetical protein
MDLGRLTPASEVAGGRTILKLADHALSKMPCPPVTSEAGARRPRSISNLLGLCQTRKTPTLPATRAPVFEGAPGPPPLI